MKRPRPSHAAGGDPFELEDPHPPLTDAQRRIIDLETQVVSLLVAADRAAATHELTCQYARSLADTQWLLAEARRENAEMYARLCGLLRQMRALSPRRVIEPPARTDQTRRNPR